MAEDLKALLDQNRDKLDDLIKPKVVNPEMYVRPTRQSTFSVVIPVTHMVNGKALKRSKYVGRFKTKEQALARRDAALLLRDEAQRLE